MNNRAIKTYEDLEQEEQRLSARLVTLKTDLQEDITGVKAGLKEKLNPLKKIKETVRNLFVRDDQNGPVLNFALNFVLDFIIRLFIPSRTNVFTKTIIPFITKNYVSNLITDEQRTTVMKAVNNAIGKVDQLLHKAMQKKPAPADYKTPAAKAAFSAPVTSIDTNPMNL